jgi:hypothetical protein
VVAPEVHGGDLRQGNRANWLGRLCLATNTLREIPAELRRPAVGSVVWLVHAEQDKAIAAYLARWRNQHAGPKRASRSAPRSAARIACPTYARRH